MPGPKKVQHRATGGLLSLLAGTHNLGLTTGGGEKAATGKSTICFRESSQSRT